MKEIKNMKDIIENEFNEHIKTVKTLDSLTETVANAAQLCIDSLKVGGKILLFGTTFGFTFAHGLAYLINKKLIPHYWLPNWSNVKDPSARELGEYKEN
jgi:phosphoheptose isomerase